MWILWFIVRMEQHCRDLMRLDGTWCKKQVWHPPCSKQVLWEQTVFSTVWKKVLVTLLGFFGAQGIVSPCPPLIMPLQHYIAQLFA